MKVVDVMDCSQQKTFRGHDAPVLSLSFDPKDIFLVIIFFPFFFFSFFFFVFNMFKIVRELAENFTQLIKRLFGLSVEPVSIWYYGCNYREIYCFIPAGIS